MFGSILLVSLLLCCDKSLNKNQMEYQQVQQEKEVYTCFMQPEINPETRINLIHFVIPVSTIFSMSEFKLSRV